MRIFVIPLVISLLFALFAAPLVAQNCGCAEQDSCVFVYPPNSTTQVCYDVTSAMNNDLSDPAQGVCGVSINFTASRIASLELSLTSPDGTSVQLTGTSGLCDPLTPIANWDILFVPCSETPRPDTITLDNGNTICAFPGQFDNCPGTWNWLNNLPPGYSGSYHPFNGCLEDFNSGTVNGKWCLDIVNGAQNNGGRIIDFEVIFCDNGGFNCCDADAGLIFTPDVAACEGDSSLAFNINPLYGAIVPDTAKYGYTFMLTQNDTIIAYLDKPNLISYPPGTYELWGLSFLLTDSTSIPALTSDSTATKLRNNLAGSAPFFCGNVSTNGVQVVIAAPPAPVNLTESICEGQSFAVGDSSFSVAGSYTVTLNSFANCDSIVNLSLAIRPVDTINLSQTICNGDSFMVGDSTYNATGTFTTVLTSSLNCDSIVILDLTALAPIETFLTDTICAGDTLFIGTDFYTATGVFSTILQSFNNCDSLINLDLTVISLASNIAPATEINCIEPAIILDGSASSNDPGITFNWTTANGHFVGPTNSALAVVDSAGTYFLTVELGGCLESDSMVVVENHVPPIADAGQEDTLNCQDSSLLLDATNSSGSSPLFYSWSAQNGSPVPNPTSPTPSISQPDIYQLVVTNSGNGCTDTANVEILVDVNAPQANAGADLILDCTNNSLSLDGSASLPSDTLLYQWTTLDGNITSGAASANPVVNSGGTYQLIVSNSRNFCRDTDFVQVSLDTLAPTPVIGPVDSLTCINSVVTLDGSASAVQPGATFHWLGNIASGQATPVATTSQAGFYTLEITNPLTGCMNATTVEVVQDISPPTAAAGNDRVLNCGVISVELGDTSVTSTGNAFLYDWTCSDGGHFLSQNNIPNPVVDSACTYVLTVTNIFNGCTATDSVVVTEDFQFPTADAGTGGVLDCQNTSVQLDGTNSSTPPFSLFEWRDSNDSLLSSSNLQITVDYASAFFLTITFGFCSQTDSAVVTENINPPTVNAGPDILLDCDSGRATLNGNGSDLGPNFVYSWTTADGIILSGENTLNPIVDSTGTYVLEVLNTLTNCNSFDTTLVSLDSALCRPVANAGPDGLINCLSNSFQDTLQASGSAGPVITYKWTTLNGTIFNQNDPFAPIVSAGTFVFSVTNEAVFLSASDTVTVVIDTIRPVAEVGPNTLLLDCPSLAACYQLDASNSSQGPEFQYEWQNLGGSICSATDVLNAEILGEGVYFILVTNSTNGCTESDAVSVILDGDIPLAEAGPSIQMDCGDTSVVLDCTGSSTGPTIGYQWFASEGNLNSGGATCNPVVSLNNPIDTFFLVTTDGNNLCRDTDFVQVFEPTGCFPSCDAGADQTITCAQNAVLLDGSGSDAGPDIIYQWGSLNGNIIAGETTPTPLVDAAGLYELQLTRNINGAMFTSSCEVQVFENISPPNAEAGPDFVLTCTDTSLILDGSGSAIGAGISYQWTTPNGNIVSGDTTEMLLVDRPGVYNLLVTNVNNGCSATDFAIVGLDTMPPLALIDPNVPAVDCAGNTIILFGNNSSPGTYLWTTNDGSFAAGSSTTSQNAFVNSTGTYCLEVTASNGCTDSTCIFVPPDSDAPQCDAGSDLVFTCTDSIFVLNGSASGAPVNALEFSWTTLDGNILVGENTQNPQVNAPGTYQLEVTNTGNTCKCFSSVQVLDATTPPSADAGPDMEINCSSVNFSVQLDAGNSTTAGMPGSLNFDWLFDGDTICQNCPVVTVDSAGTYTLLATNTTTNCFSTDLVMVTIDQTIPSAEAGQDTTLTCARSSLELEGNNSTTGPTILHLWNSTDGCILSGDSTTSPLIACPGTYFLTVLDTANNCTVTDSVSVLLDTISPIALIDTSQNLTLTCSIPTLPLDGSNSLPVGNLTYQWSNGQNGPLAMVDASGQYMLTVTHNRTGCTDETSVVVQEDIDTPMLSISDPPPISCLEEMVQLEATAMGPDSIFEFQWAGPIILSGGSTASPTVGQFGLYFVTITNASTGCTNSSTIFVPSDIAPPDAVATASGLLDCMDLMVELTGEGSSTGDTINYQWTTQSAGTISEPGSLNTLVNAPGWYVLGVTNTNNGCTAIDSVLVGASSLPITDVQLSLDPPNCLDNEGTIFIDSVVGGTPPFVYSLNNDIFITFPQFSFLDPGTYQMVIEDVNGCEMDTTILLNPPGEVVVDLGDDLFIQQGDSVTLQAQVNIPLNSMDSVIWQPLPNPECPNCLSQGVRPQKTSTFRITVLDANGCQASDKITIVVNEERPVYVPNAFSPNGDSNNDLFLLYAGQSIASIRSLNIFDRWGNLVFAASDFQPNDPAFGWDGTFRGRQMNPAVFVWVAEIEFLDGEVESFKGDVTLVR